MKVMEGWHGESTIILYIRLYAGVIHDITIDVYILLIKVTASITMTIYFFESCEVLMVWQSQGEFSGNLKIFEV